MGESGTFFSSVKVNPAIYSLMGESGTFFSSVKVTLPLTVLWESQALSSLLIKVNPAKYSFMG